MSVEVLPAKVSHGPSFQYPHLSAMKEARVPAMAAPMSALDPLKRRDSKGVNITNFDPNCIIYNCNSDTTYLRGRLLGKVSCVLSYYILQNKTICGYKRLSSLMYV